MATLNSEWQSEFRKIVNFKLWKSFSLIKIILLSHSFLIWKKKKKKKKNMNHAQAQGLSFDKNLSKADFPPSLKTQDIVKGD